jgi:two-component sensor histidine kinase
VKCWTPSAVIALVDSLMMMSARSASSAEEFPKAVRGRLGALNKAHELVQPGLSETEIAEPRPVPLQRVIADILEPYAQPVSQKFPLTGPDVQISPKSMTGIALILHELATNAAKYGALGHADGRLLVSWTVSKTLDLQWCERGNPAR